MRRLAGMLLVASAASVLFATAAHGQVVPTVRVSRTAEMFLEYQCDVAEPNASAGSFTLERDDTSSPLTVTYHISGGPTDLNSDPTVGADHTVDLAAGQSSVTVTVNPASGGGDARVQLVGQSSYQLGDPSSSTIEMVVAQPLCAAPLPLLTDAPTNAAQTIQVGEQPVPLERNPGILGLAIVSGDLPAGLTLNDDGTWSGTAAEPGTFTVTLCFADPVCATHGSVEFTLTVLPRDRVLVRTGADVVGLAAVGLALIALGIAIRRPAVARLG